MTQNSRRILMVALALCLALAPSLVEAKAGKGSSMGSRGSRTYTQQPYNAAPVERSITPQTVAPQTAPQAAPAPQALRPQTAAPAAAAPGFFQRNPFLGGVIGGLVGAGIGSLLFGGHFFGSGIGGFVGLLLQLLVLAFLIKLAVGFFTRRSLSSAPSGAPTILPREMPSAPALGGGGGGPAARTPLEFQATQEDLAAFEGLLVNIQGAWSHGDVAALQRLTTPEMAGYMAQQLRENQQQGVENRVEQVRLVNGEVLESWREDGLEYATVGMTWNAVDYTVQRAGNRVVEGNPNTLGQSSEVWTLVRRAGGPWQLSAIQQV